MNWDEEMKCFDTFSREVAEFYSVKKQSCSSVRDSQEPASQQDVSFALTHAHVHPYINVWSAQLSHVLMLSCFSQSQSSESDGADLAWTVEHVICPALRCTLLPPRRWADDATFLQLANLPDLYRVFERC